MRVNFLTSLLLVVLLSGCSSASFLAVEDGPKGFLPTQSIGLRSATELGALAPIERYSFLEICDRVEVSTFIIFKTNNYHNCELLTKYMQHAARTTATGYIAGVVAPVVQTGLSSAATAYGMHQIGRGIGKSGSNISSTTNNSSQGGNAEGGDASAEGGDASAEGGIGQGGIGQGGNGGQGGIGQGGHGGNGGNGGNVGNVSNNSSSTANAGAMSASSSASNSSANNNNAGGYSKPSSHGGGKPSHKPSAPSVKQNNYTKQSNTSVIKQNMNVGGTNY